MNNFSAIYKILSTLEKAMDLPEFDVARIGPEKIGISEERWKHIMEMLVDCGYVKNVIVEESSLGLDIEVGDIRITLSGLEYLRENSMMRKIYNAAKGVKDVTPFV